MAKSSIFQLEISERTRYEMELLNGQHNLSFATTPNYKILDTTVESLSKLAQMRDSLATVKVGHAHLEQGYREKPKSTSKGFFAAGRADDRNIAANDATPVSRSMEETESLDTNRPQSEVTSRRQEDPQSQPAHKNGLTFASFVDYVAPKLYELALEERRERKEKGYEGGDEMPGRLFSDCDDERLQWCAGCFACEPESFERDSCIEKIRSILLYTD